MANAIASLIQSLSDKEKRGIRSFLLHEKDRKDLNRLFEVYASQPDPKVQLKHLTQKKFELYNLIIEKLSFDSTNEQQKFFKSLSRIEVLFKKHLYEYALKELLKAKQKLLQMERYNDLLIFYDWEIRIRIQLTQKTGKYEVFDKLHEEYSSYLKEYKEIIDYFNLYFKLNASVWGVTKRNESKIQSFIRHPLMQKKVEGKSAYVKYCYYSILMTYSQLHPLSKQKTDMILIGMFDLIKSSRLFPFDLGAELIAICNICSFSLNISRSDYAENLLKIIEVKLHECKNELPTIYRNMRLRWIELTLIYYKRTDTLEKVDSILLEESGFIQKSTQNANKMLLLSVNLHIVSFYIFLKKYDEAHKWFNQISKIHLKKVVVNRQNIIDIINLVIHYELGNLILLEALVNRLIRNVNRFQKFRVEERAFVKMMKALVQLRLKDSGDQKIKDALKKASKIIDQDFSFEKSVGFFNYRKWVDNKIAST